jgi:hypothetical protein
VSSLKLKDFFELRPYEKKLQDEIKQFRNRKGLAPKCYTRFAGTAQEDFFCDEQTRDDIDKSREEFLESLTSEDTLLLQNTRPEQRDIVRQRIREQRKKELDNLDDKNFQHIPSSLGYLQ